MSYNRLTPFLKLDSSLDTSWQLLQTKGRGYMTRLVSQLAAGVKF